MGHHRQLEVWLLQAPGCPFSGELLWGLQQRAALPKSGTPAPRPAAHKQSLTLATEAQPQPQGGTNCWCRSSRSTPRGQAETIPCSAPPCPVLLPSLPSPENPTRSPFPGSVSGVPPQQQASKPRPPWEGFPGGAHLHRGVTTPTTACPESRLDVRLRDPHLEDGETEAQRV